MPHLSYVLAILALAQAPAGHADNPVFREVTADGLTVDSTTVRLPAPSLPDGLDAEATRAALRSVAGDDRAVRELLRDSVTAPFLLKTRDVKADGAIIRAADLWFVVHARLEEVDPDRALRQAEGRSVEVGNMRFEGQVLADHDLRGRDVMPLAPLGGRREWYTHLGSRLLDRISVEATDRAVATRTGDSLLIAARTDRAFDVDKRFPNRWATLTRQGNAEARGPEQSYAGGVSYVKITRLAGEPEGLFVEAHLAYVEPLGWFQGNPILRSKFGLIAQDQVRALRREIEKKRSSK